jgi:predicted RNA-binding protein with PIN domain
LQYLIDGNNLLHAIREAGLGPPVGREGLCKLVAAWACRTQTNATVVFDGFAPQTALARQLQQPGITLQFSGPESADSVIEDYVARATAPVEITVITTDRAIQHAVRYRRARAIDSESFVGELYDRLQPDVQPAAPVPEKPDDVSAAETEEWLNRFSENLDDLPDNGP